MGPVCLLRGSACQGVYQELPIGGEIKVSCGNGRLCCVEREGGEVMTGLDVEGSDVGVVSAGPSLCV